MGRSPLNPPTRKRKARSSTEPHLGKSDAPTETSEILERAEAASHGKVTKLRDGIGSGGMTRRPVALEALVLHGRVGKTRSKNEASAGEGTEERGGRGNGVATRRIGVRGSRSGKVAQRDRESAEGLADAFAPVADHAVPVETPVAGAPVSGRAEVGFGLAGVTIPALSSADGAATVGDDVEAEPAGRSRRKALGAGSKRGSGGAKAGKADLANYVVAPAVGPAELRPRHYGVIALFLLMVVVPTAVYSWYLWNRSADQYESDVGFGSRTENPPSTLAFLGALGGGSSSSSSDMDILNQFIVSQNLVSRIDKKLDLRAIYSKPANDPLATLDPKGSIEDLVKYWQRMVVVNFDSSTGLMNLRVFAFDPKDAQSIAQAVLDESAATINDLSMTAQDDTTKYSKDSLQIAEDRLSRARLATTEFRVKNHLVDPSSDLASQMSVMNTLVQQQAASEIDLDLLAGVALENDPRVAQLNRRIEVIKNRIVQEQAKFGGATDSSAAGYATLLSDYERLKVDEDFAEKAYLSSLAAFDQAVSDAQHKTRYLTTFVEPTLAEASTAPNRPLTAALTALIGFLAWAISVLIYYALRDRR